MTLTMWERRAEWPLCGLAVVFLGCYAWPILDLGLSDSVVGLLSTANFVIWLVFAIDYGIRVYLADEHKQYVRGHLADVAMLALPMLRPLRALRVLVVLGHLNTKARSSFRGQAAVYIAGAVPLVLFVAALAMLDAERADGDANIVSFADALWWACTTITTVGYGDRFPVSGEGRMIAVALMVAGIALLGVVTAALASWFIERLGTSEKQTQRDLDLVLDEVRSLRRQIDGTAEDRPVA